MKTFTKWSYQLCSHLAPKHETLYFTKYDYDEKEPAEQGIKAFIKGLNTPYTAIPNGYDPEQWPLLHKERKPMSFITLSGSFEYPFQVALKGIDLILEVAALFPDCTFTIAGVPEWKKLDIKSNNVMVLPPIRHKDLPELFNEYEYYMQLSMAEGFPNALCEAMLCGCIPIVSNVFSMPEIVGECGYILKKRNFSDLQNLINEIKGREPVSRKSIRGIIEKKYTYNERKNKFQQFFKKMTTPNPL
ncbi:MAG: glycosyltransferase [Bacteroidetes bacterium]|nr:glycosyltransferase [Bacteroidota bacterium]